MASLGLFDSYFLKLLLKIIFENTENTILVFGLEYNISPPLVINYRKSISSDKFINSLMCLILLSYFH